jgi:lipopolysaccharide export system permease protein
MRILNWYILRLHLVPLLLGFGVVTFILEMDVLFDYLDLVVNRGVAVGIVAQLFMLVLVAVLMTFGRLSQDNEITALRASGVNLGEILLWPLGAAGLLAVGLTLFNNHVLPESNHAFANLLIDIGRMRPTVKLHEGVFITDLPGYNLLVQSVNGRTNEMRGVTIYQFNAGGPPTTILARRGYLSYTPDGRTAVLQLSDGEIHELPQDDPGGRKYRRLTFREHTIYIANAGGVLERGVRDTRSDREMSAKSLRLERARVEHDYQQSLAQARLRLRLIGAQPPSRDGASPGILPRDDLARALDPRWLDGTAAWWIRLTQAEDPLTRLAREHPDLGTELELARTDRDVYRKRIAGLSVEIHKKFSLPFACIVFVLIGAPLGMRVRRAGPAVAFVSILFFLFYYLCLVGGEELANRLLLPPWFAMWLPNLVLGSYGLMLTLRACDIIRPRVRRVPRELLAA